MLPTDSKLSQLPSTQGSSVQDSILNQNSLNSIKSMGRDKDPQAMRELAKKFEAMFVAQMLKTMREANDVFAEDSYFGSNEQNFHRDMMDQQLVLNLTAGRGIGLADQFYRNMMRDYGQNVGATEASNSSGEAMDLSMQLASLKPLPERKSAQTGLGLESSESTAMDEFLNAYYGEQNQAASPNAQVFLKGGKTSVSPSQQSFIDSIRPHAERAAATLNVSADVIMAQAALETGWGKHVIHTQAGENSFNLFNIKAGGSWQGDSINVSSLEYSGNKANIERSDFRKYRSYAESFSDYVKLLQNNERYKPALDAGQNAPAFAQALQDAGYATDPQYASKIRELLNNDVFKADAQADSANTLMNLASVSGKTLVE